LREMGFYFIFRAERVGKCGRSFWPWS